MFAIPMSLMETLVMRALRGRYNVKFLSQPALGKTKTMEGIRDKMLAANPDFFFAVWDGGTMTPTDAVMSMPDMEAKSIRKLVDAGIPNAYDTPDLKGIIYVGEVALMGMETSRGFQKLWNHEDIGGSFRVPDGVIFVGDGNRLSDKSGAQQESRANGSRFKTFTIEYDPDYALEVMKSYHERVAAYAIRFPQEIDNYTDVFENDKRRPGDMTYEEGKLGVWCNLRSWDRVSSDLADANNTGLPLLPVEIAASVGSAAEAKFSAFCKMLDNLATLEDIEANPEKVAVPSKMDEQYALSTMLAILVRKDTFKSISIYMQRFSAEIQVVFFRIMNDRLMKAKDANSTAIRTSPEYKKWITSPHISKLLLGASE